MSKKIFNSYDELFNDMMKNLVISLDRVAEIAKQKWMTMILDRFYSVPEGSKYDRTYETLSSISVVKTEKIGNSYYITIGYDDSKIQRARNSAGVYIQHEVPEMMGNLFEYGGIWRHDPDGIRAIDDMIIYSKSIEFRDDFAKEMKKLGYVVTN